MEISAAVRGKTGVVPEKSVVVPGFSVVVLVVWSGVPGQRGPVLRAWRAATGDAVSY